MNVTIERLFDPHNLDTPLLVTNIYSGLVVGCGVTPLSAIGRSPNWRAKKQPKYKAGTIG
jgi:hypothetical protein